MANANKTVYRARHTAWGLVEQCEYVSQSAATAKADAWKVEYPAPAYRVRVTSYKYGSRKIVPSLRGYIVRLYRDKREVGISGVRIGQ